MPPTRPADSGRPTTTAPPGSNGGRQWHVLGTLPTVQVSDLGVQARDSLLVISTYGRGMYAMDALKVRAIK